MDLDPRKLAQSLNGYGHQELNSMPWATLLEARKHTLNQEDQNRLANYEHRAYARENVAYNPNESLPLAIATLGYQPYKMLKGTSRSDPSLGQMGHGLLGIAEGLGANWMASGNAISSRIIGKDIPTLTTGLAESLKDYLQGSNKANKNRQ